MDKKAFFEHYSKILGGTTFSETYSIYKSLDEGTQKQLTIERTRLTKKKLLEKNPDYYKDQHKSRIGHEVSQATRNKIKASLKKTFANKKSKAALSEAQKRRYAEHPKSEETIEKQRQSLLKTYSEQPEVKERISASVKQYYANHPEHRDEISKKTSEAMQKFYKTEKGIANLKKWTDASRGKGTSKPEQELQEFVKSLDSSAIFNDRSTLHNGLELDAYCPDKKVAFEYDGDIWHSEAFKPDAESSQLKKTLACEELGIRLVHVFSDEWEYKKDICKSIIASSLGVYKKKYMARRLKFAKVSKAVGTEFFKANHIQGNAPAQSYYGLLDKMRLVQCVSIGKNRFRRDGSLELIRMATLKDCEVVGGFSKLLKHALEDLGADSIGSYVDRRLFNARGYMSSGWELIGYSGQSYFYTDGDRRWNRLSFTKQACLKKWPECTPDMTEHQMCLDHGLYRIFDCGTIKVEYHADKKKAALE